MATTSYRSWATSAGGYMEFALPGDEPEAGGAALYHVAIADDWAAALHSGRYEMSTRGRTLAEEGFIHCSFSHQLDATAARFYGDVDDVVLLRIDPDRLGSPVVTEDLVGAGEPFPHVYGPIDVVAVVDARPWPRSLRR